MTSERILTIDAARFIGISLIILAHVLGPGSLLFQIRSFDVPLMVFVSGLTGARKEIPDYLEYIVHRFLRLIVPVWLFYTLFFIVLFAASKLGSWVVFPSGKEIIRTYLCLDGYGWIIRVFILITLVSPFLIKLEKTVRNPLIYLMITAGFVLVSAALIPIFKGKDSIGVKDLWDGCVLSLIGYIPAYMAGLRMRTAATTERLIFVVVFTIAAAIIFLSPEVPFNLEHFKRPPQYPFTVYGIAVSCLVWFCQPLLKVLAKIHPCMFIGQNTIWIYLWHILILAFIFRIVDNWLLQYVIVYSAAVGLFTLQYHLSRRHFLENKLARFLIG